MAEIYDLSRTDNSNADATKLGFPEGMRRSDVNDRGRQLEGAIRRWYEDAEWTRLLNEQPSPTFTVSKLSATSIRCGSSPATNATAKFPVGTLVRVSVSGASAVEGSIASASYSSPNTDVVLDFPPMAAQQTLTGTSGDGAGAPANFTLAVVPITPGTVRISDSSVHTRGLSIVDDGSGLLVHPVDGIIGTIDYTGGICSISGMAVAFDADAVATYSYTSQVPNSANLIEIFLAHSIREAAMRDVGTGAGQIPLAEQLGPVAFKQEGPSGGIDADTVDGEHAGDLVARARAEHFVFNPSGKIAQRGTAITSATHFPNNDDAYVMDRWTLLAEANNRFNVNQILTDGPAGVVGSCIELLVTAANPAAPNSDEGGLLQVLTAEQTQRIAGNSVSLSFYAKASGGMGPLRAMLLSWGSTADAVTSDIVNAWGAASVDPTLVANWTKRGSTLVGTAPVGAWQRFTLENVAIPAGVSNLALFVWIDDNDFSPGDAMRLTGFQLDLGASALPFRELDRRLDLVRCMAFFQKTFPQSVAPVRNVGNRTGTISSQDTWDDTGIFDGNTWRFAVPLRTTPAGGNVQTYNPGAADVNWSNGTAPVIIELSDQSLGVHGGNGLGDGRRIHLTVDVEL